MRLLPLLVLTLGIAGIVIFGCSSKTGTTCTPTGGTAQRDQAGSTPAANQCVLAGGQCMSGSAGTLVCPQGTHLAPQGSPAANGCGYQSYGGGNPSGTDPCGQQYYDTTGAPKEGMPAAQIPCCLPGADDAGSDAPSDANSEADAPASIGSCAGETCLAGCSCGIFPTTGSPACFCSDAGAGDGGRDAAVPNCGTIFCFAGCSCANPSQSACGCP